MLYVNGYAFKFGKYFSFRFFLSSVLSWVCCACPSNEQLNYGIKHSPAKRRIPRKRTIQFLLLNFYERNILLKSRRNMSTSYRRGEHFLFNCLIVCVRVCSSEKGNQAFKWNEKNSQEKVKIRLLLNSTDIRHLLRYILFWAHDSNLFDFWFTSNDMFNCISFFLFRFIWISFQI